MFISSRGRLKVDCSRGTPITVANYILESIVYIKLKCKNNCIVTFILCHFLANYSYNCISIVSLILGLCFKRFSCYYESVISH